MLGENTQRLLDRVALRISLGDLGQRLRLFAAVAILVYALGLLVARFLALIPDWFTPTTLLIPLATALLVSTVLGRRASTIEAARLLDRRAQTNDLFLTAATIEPGAGQFSTIVLGQAETSSTTIDAREIVPLDWYKGAMALAAGLVVVAAGVLFLPAFDPLGKAATRERRQALAETLAANREATRLRAQVFAKKDPLATWSPAVEERIKELTGVFRQTRTQTREENHASLAKQQKQIGEMWRQAGQEQISGLAANSSQQQIGWQQAVESEQWRRQLANRDGQGLRDELAELRRLTRKLANPSTSAREKEQAREELRRRLQRLSDFARNEFGEGEAERALRRALEQLAISQADELSRQALADMLESLDLADLELEELLQLLRDLEGLEEALVAVRLAQQVNDLDCLEEGECRLARLQGLGDYVALYRSLLGQGMGPGLGPPGHGGSGVPEDDSVATDFQPELSQSALVAGKNLLSWKTKGLSAPGQATEAYVEAVREVKQGVSEAILSEQVPPGYHEAIKKYFATIAEDEQ